MNQHQATNTLKHSPEFSSLKSELESRCKRGKTYFYGNPGNWGDALIRQGGIELLNDTNIKYVELFRKPSSWIRPFLTGGNFIYGGSGAWCKYYNTGEKYIRLFSKRFKTIVLPSTFEKNFYFPKVRFYCRDKMESQSNMPEATFCHDLAFYLTPQSKENGNGAGYFFRLDAERDKQHSIPKDNFDISRKGNQLSDAYEFISEIDKYEEIFTDRLHVGIAGSLLGKKVNLYSNSYFKTRAIYNSSIESTFENCVFHSTPFTGAS